MPVAPTQTLPRVAGEGTNESLREFHANVTVVIVNWNGERFLDRCLSALLAQTVAPSEIILVDNASSDASLDVVRRFPSVRLLAQTENLGFARGNNLAIEAAATGSEWIALLNPDAFVAPFWLEGLLSAAHDYPDFDVFGSKLVDASDPAVLDGTGDAYHVSGMVWRMGHGALVSSDSGQACEVFSPCAAAALYRRSALQGRGGVILRAKRDALLSLPVMWRKRQAQQKKRVVSVGEIWWQIDKRMIPTKLGRKKI